MRRIASRRPSRPSTTSYSRNRREGVTGRWCTNTRWRLTGRIRLGVIYKSLAPRPYSVSEVESPSEVQSEVLRRELAVLRPGACSARGCDLLAVAGRDRGVAAGAIEASGGTTSILRSGDRDGHGDEVDLSAAAARWRRRSGPRPERQVDAQMELSPPTLAPLPMLRGGPLAFTNDRKS